jgi:hypothetical protein
MPFLRHEKLPIRAARAAESRIGIASSCVPLEATI